MWKHKHKRYHGMARWNASFCQQIEHKVNVCITTALRNRKQLFCSPNVLTYSFKNYYYFPVSPVRSVFRNAPCALHADCTHLMPKNVHPSACTIIVKITIPIVLRDNIGQLITQQNDESSCVSTVRFVPYGTNLRRANNAHTSSHTKSTHTQTQTHTIQYISPMCA